MKKKILTIILFVGFTMVACMNNQSSIITANKQESKPTEIVELPDGATYTITATPVLKEINGKKYQMYAYNDMIPGPILKVTQGSKIKILLKTLRCFRIFD